MKKQTHKDFIRWAELAANAEQSGNLKQAADLWQKASTFAQRKANRNWAEARQAHCEHNPPMVNSEPEGEKGA